MAHPRARARPAAPPSRGNALIEFVLLLPLLAMLVMGAIDWGWYFTVREVAVNAVRQGARVGSASPSAAQARDDALAAVRTYLLSSLGRGFDVPPAVTLAPCSGAAYQCVAVSLTDYPVVPSRPDSSLTGLVAWTHAPPTLSVRSEMRLEVQP